MTSYTSTSENGATDPITCRGRRGYAFALHGVRPEFVVHYPTSFRFREHEMLAALRSVIVRLELAPVIHWQRDGGAWIFNLWEATHG